MTVTPAGGEKILAILPLKCAIFSANQGFGGYATWSLPHIGRLEDLVKMTHAKMGFLSRIRNLTTMAWAHAVTAVPERSERAPLEKATRVTADGMLAVRPNWGMWVVRGARVGREPQRGAGQSPARKIVGAFLAFKTRFLAPTVESKALKSG